MFYTDRRLVISSRRSPAGYRCAPVMVTTIPTRLFRAISLPRAGRRPLSLSRGAMFPFTFRPQHRLVPQCAPTSGAIWSAARHSPKPSFRRFIRTRGAHFLFGASAGDDGLDLGQLGAAYRRDVLFSARAPSLYIAQLIITFNFDFTQGCRITVGQGAFPAHDYFRIWLSITDGTRNSADTCTSDVDSAPKEKKRYAPLLERRAFRASQPMVRCRHWPRCHRLGFSRRARAANGKLLAPRYCCRFQEFPYILRRLFDARAVTSGTILYTYIG